MAKVALTLRTAEARADGTAPLYLVCRHKGARAVLALGLGLRPRDWNPRAREVRRSHPDADRLNEHLRLVKHEAEAELAALVLAPGQAVTAARIRDRVRARLAAPEPGTEPGPDGAGASGEAPPDFLAYARELVEGYRLRGQYGTWEVYRAAVGKLDAFHRRECGLGGNGLSGDGLREESAPCPLPFDAVTPRLARRFHAYLVAPKPPAREEAPEEGAEPSASPEAPPERYGPGDGYGRGDGYGLGNGPNTAAKAIQTLRSFYKRAMEEGLVPYGPNPFHAVKAPRVPARKQKLTLDEVRRLARAPLAGPTDGLLRDVRDWWLFAFYAGGMRFSDVATLERRHLVEEAGEVRVLYRMGKTKGLHGVLLVPAAVALLDRFGWREKRAGERVFPILDGYDLSTAEGRHRAIGTRNALANKYLRKVAARVGLVDEDGEPRAVGFHLSRHSLAGYLLESGADVHTIQRILGHGSVRVTEGYLRGFGRSTADEAMRGIEL